MAFDLIVRYPRIEWRRKQGTKGKWIATELPWPPECFFIHDDGSDGAPRSAWPRPNEGKAHG